MLSVSSGAGGEGDCGVVVVGDRGHGGHGGGLDRAAHTDPALCGLHNHLVSPAGLQLTNLCVSIY